MSQILTYKYRIKDRSAKKTLARLAYGVNQVFNWCCAHQRDIEDRYRAGAPKRKWPTHFDLTRLCKGVGADLGIHQQSVGAVCQQFARDRDAARQSPRFRSSFGARRALGWIPFAGQSRQIEGNIVTYLGKKYRFWEGGRPVPKNAKGGSFVEDALGHWYVCFSVEVDNVEAAAGAAIGIDLGLKSFAAVSNGCTITAPQIYRRHEQRLAIAARARNKGRVRALHVKIKNCRSDFLHKLSTDLARNHALIAVGNVNASKLAKTKMAKSVLDAGWSSFRSMLKYKSARYVEVDERFTSQICSECGSLPSSRPSGIADIGVRHWICSDCGASHDRDVNAARNILNVALSAQRLAEGSRGSAIHAG